MEKLTKDISEIIIAEIKTLNDKVKGLNFLELLKVNTLEKLFQLVSKQKFPLEQLVNYESDIIEKSRYIKIRYVNTVGGSGCQFIEIGALGFGSFIEN